MIPDLRFVIGAVTATALLSITAYGFGAAVHIAHQGKVGPLEASRALAYLPHDVRIDRFGRGAGNPFANVPVSAEGMRGQGDPPIVQAAADAPAEAAPVHADAVAETAAPAAGDHDTVDERAVVDPPLPLDGDQAAEPIDTAAPVLPAESIQPAPAAQAMPIETAPAVSAPVAESPGEPAPEVEHVGSLPSVASNPSDATPPTAVKRPQAKKAKAKAAARKARAKPKARTGAVQPAASTGYPISASGFPIIAPMGGFFVPPASRPNTEKPLWRGD